MTPAPPTGPLDEYLQLRYSWAGLQEFRIRPVLESSTLQLLRFGVLADSQGIP